ncbi:response regulator [Rhodobaculum claviforme]|uniref:Response regulator n=2 Tax=Rhodobaculum claviforme TaxID=1549854 RepID=A0A934THA2_9RHOB|nr:response regulator [Rhodobaculum claviforme]MBK5926002.1 response regulator [Rhodobaculum claviforme]
MTQDPVESGRDTALRVAAELPYLRRYARALTGSQARGDCHAAATLQAIIADRGLLDDRLNPRIALFRAFHLVWSGATEGEGGDAPLSPAEARARDRLGRLTAQSREALLMRTIEEFRPDEIAQIMRITPAEAETLVASALREMEQGVRGRVMVIEDEPLIAMDIRDIVEDMGHTVTGVARTAREAEALGRKERPDLILADIQLADNSSGIDAVNALLGTLGDVPVVFITAFPDRLLTGEKPEPAFLITKPFTAEQVRSAVSQAVFFASTETLVG